MDADSPSEPTRPAGQFLTTRWSVVIAAGDGSSSIALEELLKAYWYPLYAFVRRSGHDTHDAQDLTQGFLENLLSRDGIGKADQEKGKFRSYLLGSLKKYMANARRHANAQKRGSGKRPVSIDQEFGEQRFKLEPADPVTPADQFELSWAMSVLSRVMDRLRSECESADRLPLYDALQPRLAGEPDSDTYAMIGEKIGMSANAVSIALHRMRKRYGELLLLEIADTVSDSDDISSELAHLQAIVSR